LRKPQLFVLFALGILTLGLIVPATRYWYFREVDHHQVTSPDGQWMVLVTKRMESFPEPVEVRLKVIRNSGLRQVVVDEDIDSPDCWEDVKPGSYRVEWISEHEFRIGGRDANEGFEIRAKFDGRTWVVGPEH